MPSGPVIFSPRWPKFLDRIYHWKKKIANNFPTAWIFYLRILIHRGVLFTPFVRPRRTYLNIRPRKQKRYSYREIMNKLHSCIKPGQNAMVRCWRNWYSWTPSAVAASVLVEKQANIHTTLIQRWLRNRYQCWKLNWLVCYLIRFTTPPNHPGEINSAGELRSKMQYVWSRNQLKVCFRQLLAALKVWNWKYSLELSTLTLHNQKFLIFRWLT